MSVASWRPSSPRRNDSLIKKDECFTLQDETNMTSRNVNNQLPTHSVHHLRTEKTSSSYLSLERSGCGKIRRSNTHRHTPNWYVNMQMVYTAMQMTHCYADDTHCYADDTHCYADDTHCYADDTHCYGTKGVHTDRAVTANRPDMIIKTKEENTHTERCGNTCWQKWSCKIKQVRS